MVGCDATMVPDAVPHIAFGLTVTVVVASDCMVLWLWMMYLKFPVIVEVAIRLVILPGAPVHHTDSVPPGGTKVTSTNPFAVLTDVHESRMGHAPGTPLLPSVQPVPVIVPEVGAGTHVKVVWFVAISFRVETEFAFATSTHAVYDVFGVTPNTNEVPGVLFWKQSGGTCVKNVHPALLVQLGDVITVLSIRG